ncbi:FkbM family methyltransferase [Algoriphagus antarcticus]|uniref:FkbM family methyltransferase n=1 Tax=Algoriphagus antarcticus TaxID=238540 RepID=UPI00146C2B0B|nr:FkbM family methyltransferase [Algoriphagus antarcticus]
MENKMNDNELSGEYRVVRKLAELKPKIVFDVGANIGIWTQELKKYAPDSIVYLFEPIPDTFDRLIQNLSVLNEVHPSQIALSNKLGEFEMNYYPNQSYFSSIYPTSLGKDGIKVKVQTISGDEFCFQNSIEHINILKIDVEGAEEKVLEGFQGFLENQKISMVQFEYGQHSLDSKFLLKDFYTLFENYGYKVGKIYPNWIDWSAYDLSMENFILSNFIAVSPKAENYSETLK